MTTTTAFLTCPLCEATCGLEVTLSDGSVTKVRGDDADAYSKGFICPKGGSLGALHHDPDRLRVPLVRGDDGELHEATWDEAFELIDARLGPLLAEHGRDAVAVYIGNPGAHNLATMLYGRVLLKALGTKQIYSASTVDQMPKQVSAALMFGTGLSVPVPDLDRTSHLIVIGANPLASNGSLLTAPDMRGRLRAIRERGGKVVVIDPRRSRTAEHADEHHFIRPGTDAHLLMAMTHVLFDEGLADLGVLAPHAAGFDAVRELCQDWTPEAAAAVCGIEADEIRRLAHELAAAPAAAVYGRIGTCTQRFGTLASWLVDVLNALTGNLDREGGAMFPKAAAGQSNAAGEPGRGRGASFGRWTTRVRGLPEFFGELPVSALAEEIDTPGDGRVRALITVAGNPAVSTPNSGRLDAALEDLDFMLSLDIYVNETTRHADVILPGPSPLERPHYDLALYQLAVRHVANWTAPVLDAPEGMPQEWQTLLRLTGIVTGQGAHADVAAIDAFVAGEGLRRALADPQSPAQGVEFDEALAALDGRTGPARLIDVLLRTGPYGDGFGRVPNGISLAALEAAPHGLDLGPMKPRIPEMLRTATGMIELAPEPIAADVERLRSDLHADRNGGMVLIGRRQLRSNNSWMHNIGPLVKGKARCTAHVHPSDAERLGLIDGEPALLRSRAGEIEVPVEVTDAIMPGVVSVPHGWGHDREGMRMRVASEHAGSNSNILADEAEIDPLSGNAVLNGIPVELAPVRAAAAA